METNKPVTTELTPYSPRLPVLGAGVAERVEMGQLVQRAFRGRWGRAVVLAVAGAILGGWAGWKSQKPTYRSEGLVQLAIALRPVIKDTDLTAPIAWYPIFLKSQQQVISSQRVVELAMREPAWQATGLGTSAAAVERFAEALKVEQVPQTEHLKIQFEDNDPAVAAAGVRSIIRAYVSVYRSQNNDAEQGRLKTLEEQVAKYRKALDVVRVQKEAVAGELGPANLEYVYTAAIQQAIKLESQLGDTRLAIALAKKETATGAEPQALTVKQIAMVDGTMRAYVADRDRAAESLSQLRLQWGDVHPRVVAAKATMEAAEQKVRDYAIDFGEFQKTFGRTMRGAASAGMMLVGRSLEDLRTEEAVIDKAFDLAKQKMAQLGKQRQEITRLEREEVAIRNDLGDTTQRLESLIVESAVGGRLKVINNGEVPISPYLDRRQKLSVLGAGVGVMLPVGVILLMGLVNRRYRYSDETQEDVARSAPLLGILPKLAERGDDQEQAAAAAHCVHQIRAMLQVGKPFAGLRTYLVTSSVAGEGKTSVAVSLGLAFASAGLRTLVIDGDLVGQRVTRGFGMDQKPGLREVFSAAGLAECVQTVKGGLAVLPVGNPGRMQACSVTPTAFRAVLSAARSIYDVVLVDTGPVLGSVEATVMAPEVDGVLFTIARGQERPLVDRSLRQLSMVGARVAGFVFNLAESRDWYRSGHGSSVRSKGDSRAMVRRTESRETSGFGPLVRAVTSFLPSMN